MIKKKNSTEIRKINSKFLCVDNDYQRAIDMKRVRKIVKNFNPCLVNLVKVSYRDNKYYIFDGQHTTIALAMINGKNDVEVECKVFYGLTKQEEAKLFAEQTGESKQLTSRATFKALYTARDIDVLDLCEYTKKAGLSISFTQTKTTNRIVAVSKAFKIFTADKENYVPLMKMIKDTWDGDPDSLQSLILGGVYEFDKTYKGHYDPKAFVKRLADVSPKVIIREGRVSHTGGDKRFARQMLLVYNKKCKRNRLPDLF